MPLGELFGLGHLTDLDDVRHRQMMAMVGAQQSQNPWAAGLHGLAGAMLGRRARKLRQQQQQEFQNLLQSEFGDSPHFQSILALGPEFGKQLLGNKVTSALFGGEQGPQSSDAQTIDYLIQQGLSRDDAVQMVLGGGDSDPARVKSFEHLLASGVSQKDALGYVFGELRGGTPDAQDPAKIREIEALEGMGLTREQAIDRVYRSSPLVQVGGNQVPKAPQDHIYLRNQDGSLQIGEDGLPTAVPIPGGPADPTIKDQIAAENYKRAKGAVISQLDFIQDAVERNPHFNTGFLASALRHLPGTEAHDVHNSLNTIRSNVGFDRLRDMRAASKTGGALGQVSNKELTLLVDSLAPTSQTVSADRFLEAMNIIRRIYDSPHRYDEFFALGDGLFPDGTEVRATEQGQRNEVDALFEMLGVSQ